MRLARPLVLGVQLHLHHVLASRTSTTYITSTTTVATTTITVTLSNTSGTGSSTTTETETLTLTGPTPLPPVTPSESITGPTPLGAAKPIFAAAEAKETMTSSQSLESVVLNSTNHYRAQYEANELTWNSTLADFAQDYAKSCIWKHSGGPYGENLAAGFADATLAVDAWGNEESDYNWDHHKFSESTGHFTQLVWQNTTSVGCGLVQCENSGENGVKGPYLVCEYSPRGNVEGQFKWNVAKAGASDDGVLGFGAAGGRRSELRRSMAALVVAFVILAVFLE